jgi:hypothetical protein
MNVQSLLVQRRWYDLFLDLFVVTLLALTWAQGAAAWRTHFRLRADFERSGWRSGIIFDIGGAFLQKKNYQGRREMRE